MVAPVPQRYWPRKSELCLPWLLASRAVGHVGGLRASSRVLAAGPVQPSYSHPAVTARAGRRGEPSNASTLSFRPGSPVLDDDAFLTPRQFDFRRTMGGGESTSSLSLEPRYLSVGSQAFLPRLGMLASLGSVEKVFEPHVDERKSCLSQKVVRLPQLPADEDAAPALFLDPGVHREGAVDRNGPAVAEEHASRHRRKAVPGRDEPARLVDQRRDQPAVRQA